MKIAVLADIHANYIALQTATEHLETWNPDYVFIAGDVVNRGPRPAECLQFIQNMQAKKNWLLVRGNHEDYVISQSRSDAPIIGPVAEIHQATNWTYHQLDEDVSSLIAMPHEQSLIDPSDSEVRVVHASMLGNRDGIYPETSDKSLRLKITRKHYAQSNKTHLAVLCVGHTHRPLIRYLDETIVVNAGSVGLPFDGDHRLAYARLSWSNKKWVTEIVRLEYDREHAYHDFYDSGYVEFGGPLVKLEQIEFKTASSQLYYWAAQFQQDIIKGKISMQESVDKHIELRL